VESQVFLKRIQGYRDTGIQGYRDTGIQGYRDTGIQGYRDTGIQGRMVSLILTVKGFICTYA